MISDLGSKIHSFIKNTNLHIHKSGAVQLQFYAFWLDFVNDINMKEYETKEYTPFPLLNTPLISSFTHYTKHPCQGVHVSSVFLC